MDKSILAARAANPKGDTSALERQVDNFVYRLYNLTWEEVKVVEPEFPLGKAEYEGKRVENENLDLLRDWESKKGT
jgi:hypothetical protein